MLKLLFNFIYILFCHKIQKKTLNIYLNFLNFYKNMFLISVFLYNLKFLKFKFELKLTVLIFY